MTRSDDTVAGVGGTATDMPQPKPLQLPTMSPSNNAVGTPVFGQEYTLGTGQWRSSDFPIPVDISPAFSYRWDRCNAQGANSP